MSFRFYRRYVYGNPQRRVFLPNFWLKLVENEIEKPKNFVQFICPLEMTEFDVKNYLEKIYKVPVVNVVSIPRDGKISFNRKMDLIKTTDDYRSVYVQLPKDVNFEFPDLFPKEKLEIKDKNLEDSLEMVDHKRKINNISAKKNLPTWFFK